MDIRSLYFQKTHREKDYSLHFVQVDFTLSSLSETWTCKHVNKNVCCMFCYWTLLIIFGGGKQINSLKVETSAIWIHLTSFFFFFNIYVWQTGFLFYFTYIEISLPFARFFSALGWKVTQYSTKSLSCIKLSRILSYFKSC